MKRWPLLFLSAVAICAGCGDGVIKLFGGSGGGGGTAGTVTVTGDIRSVVIDNALRDIVVFVYTDVDKNATLPYAPGEFDSVRTVAIASDAAARTFTVRNVTRGQLQIVFLQDNATDPDGSIDAGDVDMTPGSTTNAVAILDAGSRLNTVRGNQRVTVQDIDIDLPNFVADAVTITIAPDEDDTTN
jgi:hypothetical protein